MAIDTYMHKTGLDTLEMVVFIIIIIIICRNSQNK
jgi:hypothetical protein